VGNPVRGARASPFPKTASRGAILLGIESATLSEDEDEDRFSRFARLPPGRCQHTDHVATAKDRIYVMRATRPKYARIGIKRKRHFAAFE